MMVRVRVRVRLLFPLPCAERRGGRGGVLLALLLLLLLLLRLSSQGPRQLPDQRHPSPTLPCALRKGGGQRKSRERVAAFFMSPSSADQTALKLAASVPTTSTQPSTSTNNR